MHISVKNRTTSTFYKFIIPLFALAFLLVSCKPVPEDTAPFNGAILSGKHTVLFKTSKGDIEARLDADAAPKTVTNFIALAKSGYFDGLMFHRVIPNFMIQGGDPNGNGTGGASVFGEAFEDEINAESYELLSKKVEEVAAGQSVPTCEGMTVKECYEQEGFLYSPSLHSLPMKRGALAMANRGPNTNGSQFFIITAEGTPWLEGRHTVFGNVTKGMDVIDAIVASPRDAEDVPSESITFEVEVQD